MGHDVIGISETGSGKTGAYLLPVLSKLAGKYDKLAAPRSFKVKDYNPMTDACRAEPLVIIIVPTRELALQVFNEARRLCYRTKFRPCVAYGGADLKFQIEDMMRGCDILIGTLGRINHIMEKPHVLTLRRRKFTVIDEADAMLGEPDWQPKLEKILLPADANDDESHHYMMFSATFPVVLRKMAHQYMDEHYFRIRLGRAGSTHENITQTVIWVDENQKRQALYDLLHDSKPCRTLVFVNSKRQADLLDDYLFNLNLPSTSLHSDRTQREREHAIQSFRVGSAPILITTAVAARGLDIPNVLHVINYDMPRPDMAIDNDTGINEYVHRIGRTARIGNSGTATSFYNERDESIAPDLVKILLECKQSVPDFLEQYKPAEGDPLDFGEDKWEGFSEVDSEKAEGVNEEATETNGHGEFGAEAEANGFGSSDFKADGGPAGDFTADDGGAW
jgi:ATP-dependent RNA helicase DDX3X